MNEKMVLWCERPFVTHKQGEYPQVHHPLTDHPAQGTAWGNHVETFTHFKHFKEHEIRKRTKGVSWPV